MKYLKQYIICAAAALVCLAALAGCSARNSSDSKLILDGNKFRIGQCTIREITAAGFDLETDADPDQNIPAGTMLAHPILLLKKDVPAASAVIANPGKTDLPLSQCRVYKLTGFYTIDGTDGASQVIYGGTDFKGYDREKVEKSMGRPDNSGKDTDLFTLDQFEYAGPDYMAVFSFGGDGIVTQIELDHTGYTVNK